MRNSGLALIMATGLLAIACGESRDVAQPITGADWPQDERLQVLRGHLHALGSGPEALRLYPDLIQVFVDEARDKPHPPAIVPFRYYWSPSAKFTVAICAIDRTVFICPYYVARRLGVADFPTCDVDPSYRRAETAPTAGLAR